MLSAVQDPVLSSGRWRRFLARASDDTVGAAVQQQAAKGAAAAGKGKGQSDWDESAQRRIIA